MALSLLIISEEANTKNTFEKLSATLKQLHAPNEDEYWIKKEKQKNQ